MEDLIKALQILLKYGNPHNPFNCTHDQLYICGYEPEKISVEDRAKLYKLGIIVRVEGEIDHDDNQIWDSEIYSFKYGSC